MRVLFDTSSLIPLLVANHSDHSKSLSLYNQYKDQKADFYICSHSIAELYRTLTWKVPIFDFSPEEAEDAIQDILAIFSPINLTEREYQEVIKRMVELSLTGAIINDGLISYAAAKVDVDVLITFNFKDFERVILLHTADLIKHK
jgi:predicted nucleic acid-binding protein